MKRFNLTCVLLFTIWAAVPLWVLHGGAVDAFTFPDEYLIGQDTLTLRGTGLVRELFFIKVVTAALYVQDGTPVEQALSDVGKRIEMQSFRTIPADDFTREAESHWQKMFLPQRLKCYVPGSSNYTRPMRILNRAIAMRSHTLPTQGLTWS